MERDELRLMLKIARLHYREGWLQRRISKELGLSTSKVSTLLRNAVERGFVEIHIHDPFFPLSDLEAKIKEKYNLNDVNVVPGPFADGRALVAKLGLHAALYLQKIIRKDHIIGISGGRTIHAMASSDAFNTHIPAKVVPIIGGVSAAEYHYTSNGIAAMFAHRLGGSYWQVPYPTFVSLAETREAVMQDASARMTLDMARNADVIVAGIGTQHSRVLILPHIKEEEIRRLEERGVVAEIGGHFLDKDGFPLETGFEKRLIGIELEDIKQTSTVVAVSGGMKKSEAIRSALLSGVVNVLIVDEPTAQLLVKK